MSNVPTHVVFGVFDEVRKDRDWWRKRCEWQSKTIDHQEREIARRDAEIAKLRAGSTPARRVNPLDVLFSGSGTNG